MLKISSKKICFFKNIGAIIVLNKRCGLKDSNFGVFPQGHQGPRTIFYGGAPCRINSDEDKELCQALMNVQSKALDSYQLDTASTPHPA
jgi:hypothetical protein